MDLTHIHTHLKRLFSSGGHDHAGNRIVWWQDREGEFAEELDKLDLENCHEDGVALIRLGEESTLALKVRMLLEEHDRHIKDRLFRVIKIEAFAHLLNDLQAEGEIDAQALSQIMAKKTEEINEAGNEIWLNLITREKNNPIFYKLEDD